MRGFDKAGMIDWVVTRYPPTLMFEIDVYFLIARYDAAALSQTDAQLSFLCHERDGKLWLDANAFENVTYGKHIGISVPDMQAQRIPVLNHKLKGVT